ncbi:hypothetical protein Tco_0995758, partial [Tanacetum coccineum]
MDSGGRSSLQTNEEAHRRTPNANAPKEKEELIIYLVAAKEVISAVLMTEREGKQIHCKQAAEKILPSTRNRCNHESADKATIVKLRNQWEDAD